MNEMLAANWPLLLIGAVIALVALWWVVMATRRTRVDVDRRDTLDEGAERAGRNQALIDATPAASPAPVAVAPVVPTALAGVGTAVAAAVEEQQAAANDLTQIKGLGPKLATTLNGLGVTSIAQIATWTDADIDRIDAQLGRFEGRIRRDQWVVQARLIAAGDHDGFAAQFGAQ